MLNFDSVSKMYSIGPIIEPTDTTDETRKGYSDALIERSLALKKKHGISKYVTDIIGVGRNTIVMWDKKYTIGNVKAERAAAKKRTIKSLGIKKAARRKSIVKMLNKKPMGTNDISKKLGVSINTILTDVKEMIPLGLLVDVSVRPDVKLVKAA